MNHSRNTTSVRTSMVTVAALTLVWASASLAQTAPFRIVAETTPKEQPRPLGAIKCPRGVAARASSTEWSCP